MKAEISFLADLRPLQLLLISLLGVANICVLVGASSAELGRLAAWFVMVALLSASFWSLLRTTVLHPATLGVIHVLLVMTAASWAAYGFVALASSNQLRIDATLMTVTQNLAGLLALVSVVEVLTRTLGHRSLVGWVPELASRVRSIPSPTVAIVVLLYSIVNVYRFSMGIVISGTGGVMHEVSPIQSAVLQLSAPVSGVVTVLGLLFLLGQSLARKKVGIGLVLVQAMLAFLGGRRGLIELFALGGLIWVGLRGVNFRQLLTASSVLIIVIVIAGPAFQMVRLTATGSGIHLVDAAQRAAILADSFSYVVDEFSLREVVSPDYLDNVRNRSGFLDWTIEIQERLMRGWEVRGGEVAAEATVENLPRLLFRNKLDYIGEFHVEQKIELWFGMTIEDGASTILGYAIADGGWLGVLIYFTLYGVLIAFLFRFVFAANYPLSSLWAAWAMFDVCFNLEMPVTALIGTFRMLIFVAACDGLLKCCLGHSWYGALRN